MQEAISDVHSGDNILMSSLKTNLPYRASLHIVLLLSQNYQYFHVSKIDQSLSTLTGHHRRQQNVKNKILISKSTSSRVIYNIFSKILKILCFGKIY